MDSLTALRLQIEWGVDEALEAAPVNRMIVRAKPLVAVEPAVAGGEPVALARPALRPAAAPANAVTAAQRAQELASAATSLDALRAAVEGFDGCGLSATATSLVFSDGNPEAGLMLVGDAPGADEDRAGLPFMGPAGRFLDRMLGSVGLDRTTCLMTTVIPWRPPGNRNPTDAEVSICLPFLLRHIALVRPRHLVLLGALATQSVLGTKGGIARQRGRWVEAEIAGLDGPVAVLPMLSPGFVQNNSGSKSVAWADMLKLRRTLDSSAK
jgi:uracil-DNA glycosylase family 4